MRSEIRQRVSRDTCHIWVPSLKSTIRTFPDLWANEGSSALCGEIQFTKVCKGSEQIRSWLTVLSVGHHHTNWCKDCLNHPLFRDTVTELELSDAPWISEKTREILSKIEKILGPDDIQWSSIGSFSEEEMIQKAWELGIFPFVNLLDKEIYLWLKSQPNT